MLQYLPWLEVYGISTTTSAFFDDAYLQGLYGGRVRKRTVAEAFAKRLRCIGRAKAFDLLWVEKELFPWLPAWWERFCRPLKIPMVVDYDDAVFHRYDQHNSRLVRAALGRKIDAVMNDAALVVCGNEYLADRAMAAGARRVETVPTAVDLARYTTTPPLNAEPIRVGWIGSPATARYLDLVVPALERVAQRHSIRLVTIGAGRLPDQRFPVELLPWSEDTEVELLKTIDIGIMPLSDGPFERGKCGYKLIQYMACGKPVVASPVGVNGDIVRHGQSGFLARDEPEWVECLERLCRNPDLGRSMGDQGRARVEKEFCLQVTAPRLASMLRSVVRN